MLHKMKNFSALIFTFILVLLSDEFVLGSDKIDTLSLPLNEFPILGSKKNEKVNSTDFYIGISNPGLNARNERFWRQPVGLIMDDDGSYFEYQSLVESKFSFTNQAALTLGLLKNVELSTTFSLSYGVGLVILRFDYSAVEENIEERIISRFEVIEPLIYKPWVVVETPVNQPLPYRTRSNYSGYYSTTIHRAYLLQLPVRVNYLLTDKLYFGISADIKVPLLEEIGGKTYDFFTGRDYHKIISQAHVLSKLTANAGISLKYFLSNRFFVSAQYERSMTNVFQPAAQDYFNNYTPAKVSANTLNLQIGYSF